MREVDRLLKDKKYTEVKAFIEEKNPADIAAIIDEIFGDDFEHEKEFLILFRLLPKDTAAEVFTYMHTDMQEHLIEAFSDAELRDILSQSFIDDTVDIIEEMPANVVSRILKNSSTGARKAINEILRYPHDSAGSIMTIEYVSLHKDMTVKEAFDKIRRVGVNKETIYTCYVTENRRLIGIVTVKDLFMAEEDDKINDIMETNIISVDTKVDKEDVARMFRKYDFLAIPVVDSGNRLVGIVTFDDAMDVINEENTEDFSKMAAVTPNDESYFKTGIFKHAMHRIGWLCILMISATITGILTDRYNNVFITVPILVSFMPMIMDTGGNCGSQSSVLIIRGLALDEIEFKDFFKVVFKEFRIAIMVSAVLAGVNGLRIYLMYGHDILLSAAVSISIIFTVIFSKLIGSSLPMLAKKCGLDPAIMATPLISTIVDCCSLFIYFNVAMKMLNI
ncbi:MAG: magnesium transporter [Monoglobales bacterium]